MSNTLCRWHITRPEKERPPPKPHSTSYDLEGDHHEMANLPISSPEAAGLVPL